MNIKLKSLIDTLIKLNFRHLRDKELAIWSNGSKIIVVEPFGEDGYEVYTPLKNNNLLITEDDLKMDYNLAQKTFDIYEAQIKDLKDKLHRRNMQIKDLKNNIDDTGYNLKKAIHAIYIEKMNDDTATKEDILNAIWNVIIA